MLASVSVAALIMSTRVILPSSLPPYSIQNKSFHQLFNFAKLRQAARSTEKPKFGRSLKLVSVACFESLTKGGASRSFCLLIFIS